MAPITDLGRSERWIGVPTQYGMISYLPLVPLDLDRSVFFPMDELVCHRMPSPFRGTLVY